MIRLEGSLVGEGGNSVGSRGGSVESPLLLSEVAECGWERLLDNGWLGSRISALESSSTEGLWMFKEMAIGSVAAVSESATGFCKILRCFRLRMVRWESSFL